jgi:uracil-DNA glycosylase
MIIGEAPGADDCIDGEPFMGASGKLLNELLRFAGIDRNACHLTNVFRTRPPRNDLSEFFVKKSLASDADKKFYHPQHGYVKEEHHLEMAGLFLEIHEANPKLIVCAGALPLWALTGEHKITDYRGTVMWDSSQQYKLLPTFHPDAALRDYGFRPIIGMDLQKALRELAIPGINRPKRVVKIIETKEDVNECLREIWKTKSAAFDVETDRRSLYPQVTCVCLAPSPQLVYVFPIWNPNKPSYSEFDQEMEEYLWGAVSLVLGNPLIRKIAHNATYDMSYALGMDMKLDGPFEDTMLMNHSWQVEWPKALGFLGSIYSNERAWKNMRVGTKAGNHKPNE